MACVCVMHARTSISCERPLHRSQSHNNRWCIAGRYRKRGGCVRAREEEATRPPAVCSGGWGWRETLLARKEKKGGVCEGLTDCCCCCCCWIRRTSLDCAEVSKYNPSQHHVLQQQQRQKHASRPRPQAGGALWRRYTGCMLYHILRVKSRF